MTPAPTDSKSFPKSLLNGSVSKNHKNPTDFPKPVRTSFKNPTNSVREASNTDSKFLSKGVKLSSKKHKKHVIYGASSDATLSQGFSDESLITEKSIEDDDVFFSKVPRRHTVEYSPIQQVHVDETSSQNTGGKYKLSVQNTANVKLSIVVEKDQMSVMTKTMEKLSQAKRGTTYSPKTSLTEDDRTSGEYQLSAEKEINEQIDSLKGPRKLSNSKFIDVHPNLRITDFDTKESIPNRSSLESRKSREQNFEPHTKLHFKIDKESRRSPPKLMNRAAKLTMDWASAGLQLTRATIREVPLQVKSIDAHPGAIQYPKQNQVFVTGSSYEGYWNTLGFSGFGTYTFVHGAVYNGNFKNGEFHGYGSIVYPNGVKVKGQWRNGKLISQKIVLDNGLEIAAPWTYCEMPDRRFQIEHSLGLNGADEEYLTNKQPTIEIPENCYDATDGFYDPEIQCIYKYVQPTAGVSEADDSESVKEQREMLRIPLKTEIDRITQHHRRAEPMESVGYKPDLYEEWTTGEIFEDLTDDQESDDSSRTDDSSMENVQLEVELLRTK